MDLRTVLGATQTELVLKTNVTPEIVIRLSDLLSPRPPTPEQALQSSNPLVMKLIRPEVALQGFGLQRTFSPYGHPTKNMYLTVLASFLAAGLIGFIGTLAVCHKKVGI
jgi:hypothetical protein